MKIICLIVVSVQKINCVMNRFFLVFFSVILTINSRASEDIKSILESGKLSEVSGDYEEAIRLYSKVIEIDSSNYDAHLYIGVIYLIQNQYAESLSSLYKAIAIDTSRSDAYFFRGNLQVELGSVFGAVHDYTKAIEKNPNDIIYYMNRGFAFANMGDYFNAVNDYSIAVQLDSEASKSYHNLAKMQGRLENIEEVCEKITQLKKQGSVRAEIVYLNFCLI